LNGAWKQHVVPTGAGPEGFDLSPDGKEIWAANSRDGSVAIIDRETRSVTKRLDAGTKRSNRLKFTPDGKTVLVSDMGSGQLVVIDAASHAVARRLPLGRVVEGILITPDGATAFVALTDDNAIAVIDLQTFEIKGRIEPGLGPDGMAWINGR
jgi:YVTN family beta-propeller protein